MISKSLMSDRSRNPIIPVSTQNFEFGCDRLCNLIIRLRTLNKGYITISLIYKDSFYERGFHY
ncbi:hypothetical protein [Nostoc sp. MS1]|uniref:hypothetical protein n=1 Tax=Nostoc sp. MS1 TaxID=2764711 RepID=UPI001CC36579|nr:hypothetical protein [Nostoc sp. MS1]